MKTKKCFFFLHCSGLISIFATDIDAHGYGQEENIVG